MNKKHNEFKKVTLRFLKDAGLFPSFIKYLKTKKKDIREEWFKKDHIDSIIGQTTFTSFLIEKGVCPDYKITKYFRTYLNKKYPGKYDFGHVGFIMEDDYNKIDIDTDIVTIGAVIKEQ